MLYFLRNMERLKLSGIGEGLGVVVSSKLRSADIPELVLESIQNIFPGFTCGLPPRPSFPTDQDDSIACQNVSLENFISLLHKQSILDTSLDYMSRNITDTGTTFEISRQAALSGKISFPLPNESPLGGVILIEITGHDIKDWLEAATWHEGREYIPRKIGDDLSMNSSADAVTWH